MMASGAAHKLTVRSISAITKPGLYSDGAGLFLQVSRTGDRGWIFRYQTRGPLRSMALGSYPSVSLADARRLAEDARRVRFAGRDPLEAQREREAAERAKRKTFGETASEYLELHKVRSRSRRTSYIWKLCLEHHSSALCALPVAAITRDHVLKALEPLWWAKLRRLSRCVVALKP